MIAVENNHDVTESTQDGSTSEHVSSTTSLDRTELDDLLDELLGQASTTTTTRWRPEQRRTPPGTSTTGLIQQACSQVRRRTPQPLVRNDSLSALRLTPSLNSASSPLQPLHTRLQIDIEVDQRTGSARIDSWSPVSCDSAPSGAGYLSYGQCYRRYYVRLLLGYFGLFLLLQPTNQSMVYLVLLLQHKCWVKLIHVKYQKDSLWA